MITKSLLLPTLGAILTLCLTSCLTQRTVTSGGETTEQKIIIQRPVKNLIENTTGAY